MAKKIKMGLQICDSENETSIYNLSPSGYKIINDEKNEIELTNRELHLALAYEKEFRPALHIECEDIDDIAYKLLAGILERDISVEAQRSDYYDWNLETVKVLSKNEMEKFFDILQANEDDRNNRYNEDFPTTWICQRISCKLLGKVALFPIVTSFADEDGIWLVGERINADILQTDRN